jgi:Asp-tRNA(Asn)/Glu-tRNA(Gln) amidotransferase A subunit family amidase
VAKLDLADPTRNVKIVINCDFSVAQTDKPLSEPSTMSTPADLTAAQALNEMSSGALTSTALVQSCLDRIEERDAELQAWQYIDPAYALAQAKACDDAKAAGRPLGRLHGLPVGIKDIINTSDMPTESGSPHFKGHQPEHDARCVELLREVGAVIMGKTVTTELAALAPSKTRNPVNPAHTPGGSSAGSGAAVGANMVPLALGTQTGGSVIRPASFCGVYGLKPTVGFVPRGGVTLQSHTLDTVGVYGRSVEDLALIGDALSAFEPDDAFSYPRADTRLLEGLSGAAPASVQLAFWKTPNWDTADAKSREAFVAFADKLAGSCHEVEIPKAQNVSIDHQIIQAGENAHYYGPLYDKDKSLLTPNLRGRLEEAFNVTSRDYLGAVMRRDQHYGAVADVLDNYDAILCLSAAGPAPHGYDSTGNPIFNGLWTYLGVPCISLPLLTVDGLPLGVQLVGKRREERKLLQTAKWLEAQVG